MFVKLYSLLIFRVKKLPAKVPVMNLIPTIKLTGRSIVLAAIKFTFFFLELFWIPIIKIKNNEILNVTIKIIFFILNILYLNNLKVNTYYKLNF